MKVTTDGCLFGAWCAAEIQKINARDVLDIGAGSGLLSLMIAQKNLVNITAVEIDNDAAEQARENISAAPWPGRINVVAENILNTDFPFPFDVIVSNPPFYENELPSAKETKNMAHHSYALTFTQLLSYVQNHLSPRGKFFVLLPYKRLVEIERLLAQQQLYITEQVMVSPTTWHKPFRVMLKIEHRSTEKVQNSIAVKSDDDTYTSPFISLLKEYYLHL